MLHYRAAGNDIDADQRVAACADVLAGVVGTCSAPRDIKRIAVMGAVTNGARGQSSTLEPRW